MTDYFNPETIDLDNFNQPGPTRPVDADRSMTDWIRDERTIPEDSTSENGAGMSLRKQVAAGIGLLLVSAVIYEAPNAASTQEHALNQANAAAMQHLSGQAPAVPNR